MVDNKHECCEKDAFHSFKSRKAKKLKRRLILFIRPYCRKVPLIALAIVTWYVHFYCWKPPTDWRLEREAVLPEWDYNISRNLNDYVLPQNDTILLEPRNICQDKIFLLIVVHSKVDSFLARQNIRKTWGNTTEFNYHMFKQLHQHLQGKYLDPTAQRLEYYRDFIVGNENGSYSHHLDLTFPPPTIPVRIVFLLGRHKDTLPTSDNESMKHLHNESQQYNDIIQENFIDSYNNLTIKSVMALKWITHRCLRSCAFVMKCDDDTFVHVPNMLQYLLGGTIPHYNTTFDMHDQRLNVDGNLLMGHRFRHARPLANVNSKWYMPYNLFPGIRYPDYLSGSSYLMSIDVVPQLYAAALNISLVHLEDIFITGICAERINLQRRHNPLFNFRHSKTPCTIKGSLTQHYMKNDDIVDLYAFVRNLSISCAAPDGFWSKAIKARAVLVK